MPGNKPNIFQHKTLKKCGVSIEHTLYNNENECIKCAYSIYNADMPHTCLRFKVVIIK